MASASQIDFSAPAESGNARLFASQVEPLKLRESRKDFARSGAVLLL